MDQQYLNEEELSLCKSSPESREAIVLFAKNRFTTTMKNYTLSENRHEIDIKDEEELRIVVVGKTGVGKSATANTILGKPKFKEDMEGKSVTKASECHKGEIKGHKIRVIDTPGLFDVDQNPGVILQELARVIQIFDSGIHAFVYVLNMASPRFTKEDSETLKTIEAKFGGDIKRYRLIVYSHADNNLDDMMDLDKFVKRQKNANQYLEEIFEESKNNIVALNNKTSIPAEKTRNQNVIIRMVDKIRRSNSQSPVYTNEMFQTATKKKKALFDSARQNNWSPRIMSALQSAFESDFPVFKNTKKMKQRLINLTKKPEKERKDSSEELTQTELEQEESTSKKDPSSQEQLSSDEDMDHTVQGKDANDAAGSTSDFDETELAEMSKKLLDISSSLQSMLRTFWDKKGLPQ